MMAYKHQHKDGSWVDGLDCPSCLTPSQRAGANIRRIRKDAGVTISQIGEVVGLSISGLAKIERGEGALSVDRLFRIAEALSVPVVDVLGLAP